MCCVLHCTMQTGCLTALLGQPDTALDPRDGAGGRTPLYLAATNRHQQAATLLIQVRPDQR